MLLAAVAEVQEEGVLTLGLLVAAVVVAGKKFLNLDTLICRKDILLLLGLEVLMAAQALLVLMAEKLNLLIFLLLVVAVGKSGLEVLEVGLIH